MQLGYGEGFSPGFTAQGDGRKVRYLYVFPGFGVGISDVKGENKWYRGNFDLLAGGVFIRNFEPSNGFSAGVNFLVRYNFLMWQRYVPFVEAGAGIGYLDFDLEDQEDGLIFYPQAGVGLHYFLINSLSADISLSLHHMSNAGTNMPNDGINSGLVLLGLTYYLD